MDADHLPEGGAQTQNETSALPRESLTLFSFVQTLVAEWIYG